jgi:hypothetical protein
LAIVRESGDQTPRQVQARSMFHASPFFPKFGEILARPMVILGYLVRDNHMPLYQGPKGARFVRVFEKSADFYRAIYENEKNLTRNPAFNSCAHSPASQQSNSDEFPRVDLIA